MGRLGGSLESPQSGMLPRLHYECQLFSLWECACSATCIIWFGTGLPLHSSKLLWRSWNGDDNLEFVLSFIDLCQLGPSSRNSQAPMGSRWIQQDSDGTALFRVP